MTPEIFPGKHGDLRFWIYDFGFTILDFFDWNWEKFDNLVLSFKNLNENDSNRIKNPP
jgi:hypothetical protein